MLILIAEDEPKLAAVLGDYLIRAGFDIHTLDRGDLIVPWVETHHPDLVVLDLMLPGRDGIDVCRELRSISSIPIVMTTARVEEIDRILGLELGADDYVCKPYSPREVVARIKAIFRRMETVSRAAPEDECLFQFDSERFEIQLNGQALPLTPVEVRLLSALLERPGRVLRRAQLLDVIYEDHRIVTDRTVDSHIKNVRKKIANVLPNRELIVSVYGVGYKLEL